MPHQRALLLLLAAAAAAACTCGRGGRGGRVVGGGPAARGELPWLSALVRYNDVVCGATLVSATHLVTAAHCVDGIDAASLGVLVGEYELEGALGRARRVAAVIQHPEFDAHSFDNDIAVLRLESPLPEHIAQPACLPASTTIMGALEGRHAMVSGWGKTSESGVTSNLPRKVSVKVWSEAECKSAGYGARKITPRMLCAGHAEGGRDACRGDSGGPLVTAGAGGELVLIGVVSWGRGCARPLYPGVYTRVDRALPWLRAQLRDAPCTPAGSTLRSFIANIFQRF